MFYPTLTTFHGADCLIISRAYNQDPHALLELCCRESRWGSGGSEHTGPTQDFCVRG